jgi:two-component system, OmpR family, sensor histidine kinase QseC
MPTPKLSSMQARLLGLLLTVISLVWVAAAALTWFNASHELDQLLDAHLTQSAALLVAQQTGHGPERGKHISDDERPDAPSPHKYASRVAFQVFHEGRLTLRSANVSEQPLSSDTRGFDTVTLADGQRWRVFGAQGSEGDVQVFVGEQMRSRSAILWALLQSVLMPLLYALPLLGLLGWLAVRQGLKPLRSLSLALTKRHPQAIEPLMIRNMPTEMVPVVQSLNALFERIGHMIEAERRFTADAAHELRTPIAAIRAQAQVALGAGGDETQRQQALQHTLEGCDRATHLVAQLLTLSRLEAAGTDAHGMPVDVGSIAQRIAAQLAPNAIARTQILTLEASQACPIVADDALTGVLIRNLLDNAMRYSPDGATITLHVLRENDKVTLQVDDSGPGLADADLARLGERFYRALGSQQGGSGLGWSIVRRIAEVYRAQVSVNRSGLGGLCVRVVWPAPPVQRVATNLG